MNEASSRICQALRPGDDPFPAADALQRLELPMFRVGLGGLSQEVGQHAIRKVLRPTHRLCEAAPILDQAVDDLLRGAAIGGNGTSISNIGSTIVLCSLISKSVAEHCASRDDTPDPPGLTSRPSLTCTRQPRKVGRAR
jgi:hypothetical protein